MIGIDALIGYGVYGDTKDWKKTATAGAVWGLILAGITFVLGLAGYSAYFLAGVFSEEVAGFFEALGTVTLVFMPLVSLFSSILGALFGGFAYYMKDWILAKL